MCYQTDTSSHFYVKLFTYKSGGDLSWNSVRRASLPQILKYIRIANESNAVNLTAMLLEYKNEHFSEVDPFAEFTLDDVDL